MRHYIPNGRAVGFLIVFSTLLCFQTSATAQIPDSNWQKADKQSFSKVDVGDGLQKAEQKVSNSDINAELESFLSGRSAKAAAKNSAIASGIASILASQPGFPGSQFTVKSVHADKAGNTHVILSQQRDGIPVEGATVSLHINSSGEVYDITGVANTVSINVHPAIDSTSAVKRIEAHFSQGVSFERQPSLAIYGNRLVFSARVRVLGEYGAWEMRVDANSGEILARITTIRQVDPPGYPSQGQTDTIAGNVLLREGGAAVTILGWRGDNTNPATYYLYNNGEHWQTQDNASQLYDSIAWQWGANNRIAISGAYNIEKTQAFSNDSLGRNSWDNAGRMVPVCIVNGPAGSWDGTTITVGTGDGTDLDALACIDVIAHEFGHALTDGAANLNYSYNESGALNEAYSDITGTCVEFAIQPDGRYAYTSTAQRALAGFADWLVGEDVCLQGGNPWWLRNMRDPLNHEGLEGKHPSLYRGTAWDVGGEMHFNSTVGSHCFYLISEGALNETVTDTAFMHRYGPFPGLGISAARDIVWESQFNGRIISTSFYRDARNAWIATAKELGHNAGVVAQAWAAVGVIDRTVGRPTTAILPGSIPNYSTITAALNSCVEGDLIYVYPGTYTENINIAQQNVTLVSKNRDSTIIDGTVSVIAMADGATIAGFTIDASPTTPGIQILGTSSNAANAIGISRCRFRNCDSGIVCSYGISNRIIDNSFTGCSSTSLSATLSGNISIRSNLINTRGIFVNASDNALVIGNTFQNISNDGISMSGSCSGMRIQENYLCSIGQREIYASSAVTGIAVNRNVFADTGTTSISFPSLSSGQISRNSMVCKTYAISTPSSIVWKDALNKGNYWKDYFGKDVDGDSTGDTYLPHQSVDNDPLIYKQVSPLVVSFGGGAQLQTSVDGGEYSIKGIVVNGSQSGLKIGTGASLQSNGNLQCSSLQPVSSSWLDNPNNLHSGLIFRNPMGVPVIYFDSQGVVRIRANLNPVM